jgi:HrpA-like RNA helicase
VAARVADEMGERLGEGAVGYHVRFEMVASPKTKITFLTDGTY